MGSQGQKVRDRSYNNVGSHFNQGMHGARPAVKKYAPKVAYGIAATWYVHTGPTGSRTEKMARRAVATGVGVGLFKGKDIYRGAKNKLGGKSNGNNQKRRISGNETKRRASRSRSY